MISFFKIYLLNIIWFIELNFWKSQDVKSGPYQILNYLQIIFSEDLKQKKKKNYWKLNERS